MHTGDQIGFGETDLSIAPAISSIRKSRSKPSIDGTIKTNLPANNGRGRQFTPMAFRNEDSNLRIIVEIAAGGPKSVLLPLEYKISHPPIGCLEAIDPPFAVAGKGDRAKEVHVECIS